LQQEILELQMANITMEGSYNVCPNEITM